MIKFKAGDKVRYVTTGPIGWESEDWAESDGLVKGEVYTIRSADWDDDSPYVKIEQGNFHPHIHPGHFVLAEEGTKEVIKLQPGDYVSTEGMSESEYHAVCKAFMAAGADSGEYDDDYRHCLSAVGWSKRSEGIFFWDIGGAAFNEYFNRKLTLSQILNQEENKMDVKEAYKVMQANCGIEGGDTVRVLRRAKSREMGWDNNWVYDMDRFVGLSFNVHSVCEDGLQLEDGEYAFPFFVLELVKKAPKLPESIRISSQYKAEFKEGGDISVGCQNIDFETLEKVYLTAKGVKEND